MKTIKKNVIFNFLAVAICTIFLLASTANALDIVLEPDDAQREIGNKVRVHIYADNAVELLSMGVRVSFNPAVLQVTEASKNEEDADTGWVMDADGDPATTDDQYRTPDVEIDNSAGTVTMIGGNIKGTETTGHTGKILLGYIVFEAIAEGSSNLNVDLAKYHPNPPATFDNFVRKDSTVDEPANVPGDLGAICVVANACEGNFQGADTDVDRRDRDIFTPAYGSVFPSSSAYDPKCDFDADGDVDRRDRDVFQADYGRPDCPTCP